MEGVAIEHSRPLSDQLLAHAFLPDTTALAFPQVPAVRPEVFNRVLAIERSPKATRCTRRSASMLFFAFVRAKSCSWRKISGMEGQTFRC